MLLLRLQGLSVVESFPKSAGAGFLSSLNSLLASPHPALTGTQRQVASAPDTVTIVPNQVSAEAKSSVSPRSTPPEGTTALFKKDHPFVASTRAERLSEFKNTFTSALQGDETARAKLQMFIIAIGKSEDTSLSRARSNAVRDFNKALGDWLLPRLPLTQALDVGLSGVTFSSLDLSGLNLNYLDLRRVRFQDCHLNDVNFQHSDLRGARVDMQEQNVFGRPQLGWTAIDREDWEKSWARYFSISRNGNLTQHDNSVIQKEMLLINSCHARAMLKNVEEAGWALFRNEHADVLASNPWTGQKIFQGQVHDLFWSNFLQLADRVGLSRCLMGCDQKFTFLPTALLAWRRFLQTHSPKQAGNKWLRDKVASELQMPVAEAVVSLEKLNREIKGILKRGYWHGRKALDDEARRLLREDLLPRVQELLELLK